MNAGGTRRRARGLGTLVVGAGLLASVEARAQWSSESMGGTSVEVYAPAERSPVGDGRALMVILHGCAQPASALRDSGNLEPTANSMGVVMAVPTVPDGGVLAGCWDYYGSLHSRSSPHVASVLSIVEGLLDDPALEIDPDQVYVLGLSSGGGESVVLGCVAPEVFAGVGVVAGPSLGTTSTRIASASTTPEAAATLCRQLAGANASALESQAALTFADALDFVVARDYNAVNAGMFGEVLSEGLANMDVTTVDFADLPGNDPTGTVTEYSDALGVRVAQLDSMSNTGHAWPAGDGQGATGSSFVSGNGLNMAQYAAEFFAAHNTRAGGWDPEDPEDPEDPGDPGGGEDTGGDPTDPDDDDEPDPGNADADGSGGAAEGDTDAAPGTSDGGGGGCSTGGRPQPLAMLGLLLLGLRRRQPRIR